MIRSLLARRWLWAMAAVMLLLVGIAWHDTMGDPVVRRATFAVPGMAGQPVRIALMADMHVSGPDMPPTRLRRIVEQVNALHPDAVLIAGDFVSEKRLATRHYSAQESIAPLAGLRAPLGVVAVPGNHDHWLDLQAVERELVAHGITVLANGAKAVGPLAIAGLDDDFTGNADVQGTLAQMEGLAGAHIVLGHSPDSFPDLPAGFGLMLAGHTHCGQIGWPWGGSPVNMSRYGERYSCGVVRERGNVLVTSAGLGTSVLPFRLFTRPEIWLIEIRPPNPVKR